MILLNRTFSEVSEESAQNGDTSDAGFIEENQPYTFKDLIDILKNHPYKSSSRVNRWTWFETETSQDMHSGDYRTEAVHYSRENLPSSEKYWIKAVNYLGL